MGTTPFDSAIEEAHNTLSKRFPNYKLGDSKIDREMKTNNLRQLQAFAKAFGFSK